MTHLILDCDDVLLDWSGGFTAWLQWQHGRVPVYEGGSRTWAMGAWLGISDDAAIELAKQFNASEHFCRLARLPGTIPMMSRLARFRAESGVPSKVTVLTSCGPARMARWINLTSEFGGWVSVFDSIVCLPFGASKAEWLRSAEPGVYVEDSANQAIAGHLAGHEVFLWDKRHNRDLGEMESAITRISDWAPVLDRIAPRRTSKRVKRTF